MSTFYAAAIVAAQMFNSASIPAFGLEVSGKLNMNLRVALSALNLICVRESTQSHWLKESLSTAEMMDIDMITIDKLVNPWLIDNGFIERRAVQVIVRPENGPARMFKQWPLCKEWQEKLDAVVEPEKFAPLTEAKPLGDIDTQAQWSLALLDDVALSYHRDTLQLCKKRMKELDKEKITAKYDNYGNVVRSVEQVRADKKLAVSALQADYRERRDNPFYLSNTTDFRGRGYARGGYISTQAGKEYKACIRFHANEAVSDWNEIEIYLGRLAGCKSTNDEAQALGKLERANPSSIEAESVITDPSRAIIRLDGCCNGIQWMSAFLNDSHGLKLTNLTGDKPRDLYTSIKEILELESRAEAKSLMVPLVYGASIKSLTKSFNEGKGVMDRKSEVDVAMMIETINEIVPINQYLNHVKAEVSAFDGDSISWTMPNGFRVHHKYTESDVVRSGKSFSAPIKGTERVDRRKMEAAMAPNVIHSIDAYHMSLIIAAADFPVVPIHDSFGCHSSNVAKLRIIIRDTFRQILKEDVLNDIFRQVGFDEIGAPADPDAINNPYMFM